MRRGSERSLLDSVGSPDDVAAFTGLVPAPGETYANLYGTADTAESDAYPQKRAEEERERRAAARSAVPSEAILPPSPHVIERPKLPQRPAKAG